MKKISILAAMAIACACCNSNNLNAKLFNNGVEVMNLDKNFETFDSQTRAVTPFTSISNCSSLDVYYTQGDIYEVVLEGNESQFGRIHTETKGDALTIWLDPGKYWNLKVRVRVTAPSMDGLSVAGSGSITCMNAIGGNGSMTIRVTGSGDFAAPFVDYDSVKLAVTGSGDIDIENVAAERVEMKVTGSGDIDVMDLNAEEADLMVTGSGDIKVNGKVDTCNARITGSGDITGRLAAARLSTHATGSGDIKL